MDTLRIARLRPDATLPTRKHPEDAGLDLYAVEPVTVAPHSFAIVPTGITIEIPQGLVGLIKPKGRNNHLMGAGVVDSGYQGEIFIKVANTTTRHITFLPGDSVGQLVLVPVFTPAVEEVSKEEIHNRKSARADSGGIVSEYKYQKPG
ncbi:MAG TPA: hypothetical protein PKD23_02340 [Bellilinea sp.]|jgi:dUTP pyrophosphatase|nr:hypothetical protein [Bellilinea sp.]